MILLIQDMLKLSELENNKTLNVVAVNLNKVANEVMTSLSTLSSEKKVNVSIDGEAIIYAETNHIYELIKNLIENAIKYNKENNSVDIIIKTIKDEVYLQIIDTGIGIDSVDQSRIFERFYRVQKSRSRLSGGTGLGLSIVKHICSLYNGTLTLKSKIGVGTTITIVFANAK